MSLAKCHGIIIKQSNFGDGDRMLWIFTDSFGIIKAVNRGAGKVRSKTSASSQFLCFGKFEFFSGGEIWTVNNIEGQEPFTKVQEDIVMLSLFTYFSDLIYTMVDLNNPDVETLRLFLNTLYGAAHKGIDYDTLKITFELKLISNQGFMPYLDGCMHCGEKNLPLYFDFVNGGVACNNCKSQSAIQISEKDLEIIDSIIKSSSKKMFNDKIPEASKKAILKISEKYITANINKSLSSLDYYKAMRVDK